MCNYYINNTDAAYEQSNLVTPLLMQTGILPKPN
jgi:hypothetical protein